MQQSLFFYDLETTSFSPWEGRITQFGGQRTNLDLKPLGKPVSVYIKLTADVIPDPGAVLVTGITPQKTLSEGISEADFLELFNKTINTPGTTFVGYNNIRFDDEFMRFLQYRNLYDSYSWQYANGRSRWDLLDLVRMTRALRPDGIKWPVDSDGKATNRLELLSSLNELTHEKAHDALSDVLATIEIAKLLRDKQPKLFSFSFEHRDKKSVAALVNSREPFIYTSGKYPSEYEKTTVVQVIADHPDRAGVLVYDLRHDPNTFAKMTPEQLVVAWKLGRDDPGDRLPIKTLLFNRCPAVAPLSVLDNASQERLKIDLSEIKQNKEALEKLKDFPQKVISALKILDQQRNRRNITQSDTPVDAQLYDGFFDDSDRENLHELHNAKPTDINNLDLKFNDRRLSELFPLFLARNYPKLLTVEQRKNWEAHCREYLLGGPTSRLASYFKQLEEITSRGKLTTDQKYLIEELQLWGESIIPSDDNDEDADLNK